MRKPEPNRTEVKSTIKYSKIDERWHITNAYSYMTFSKIPDEKSLIKTLCQEESQATSLA